MPPKKNTKKAPIESDEEDEAVKESGVLDLARDPNFIAALQSKLGQLQGVESGYVESLGPDVKRRINALKNLQLQHAAINLQFEKELALLEQKFAAIHQPLFDKRSQIISGAVEPTEEEATFVDEDEEDEEEEDEEVKKAKAAIAEKAAQQAPVTGIPAFWLTVLQQCDFIAERIADYDTPVLEHLTSITTTSEPTTFTIYFHFSENEFFTNSVLTKTYTIDFGEDKKQLMYQGRSYVSTEGCEINWKAGKNVGMKTIKKKQKKKGSTQTRLVTKFEKQPTFFDIFALKASKEDEDDDVLEKLEADFELADIIRERLVPNAVLWFTGEALDYDDDDDFDGGFGEEGDDADPDWKPPAGGAKPDCKQS